MTFPWCHVPPTISLSRVTKWSRVIWCCVSPTVSLSRVTKCHVCDCTADTDGDIRAIFCYHNMSTEFADTSTLCYLQCHHNKNLLIDWLHVMNVLCLTHSLLHPQHGQFLCTFHFSFVLHTFLGILGLSRFLNYTELCR